MTDARDRIPPDLPNPRQRVVIKGVRPEIDGGRYPAKATLGESVEVEADIFADGHDVLGAALLYRRQHATSWNETRMELLINDRWGGSFEVEELGWYEFTLEGWVDAFRTWRRDLAKKYEAGFDVSVELKAGAQIIADAIERAPPRESDELDGYQKKLTGRSKQDAKVDVALSEDLTALMAGLADRSHATTYADVLSVVVDPEKARFSTWYEMFPRSAAEKPGKHGTFRDVEARLPYIQSMGFDVLYLPPIHPIGRTNRKGKNNTSPAKRGDPGSPWAIGSADGGHKAIEPKLGTIAGFRRLVRKASDHGIDIAMDLALQCSPDHPYVREHPEWFKFRPDSSIQYAENPPKKYEDIYPLNFDTENWRELWGELLSVVLFWIEQGVRIFRVDNPHTKPFSFWEWLIGEVKKDYPEVIFLSEAFTRPKVMYDLAKLGFSQSYTYFAWRNMRWELTEYFSELTKADVCDFFRPSIWPNTPDILTEYLQAGGRPAFMARLVLAATLGANYGIYGPPFELMEATPHESQSEEYLDSEKYQIRHWDINRSDSLREFIARVNSIRRDRAALQSNRSLSFHWVDNEQIICYSKRDPEDATIIVVVNLDPHYKQSGWLSLNLDEVGVEPDTSFQVHDLLTDARFIWHGSHNYVELDPHSVPAHILRVHPRLHSEHDFDYFT